MDRGVETESTIRSIDLFVLLVCIIVQSERIDRYRNNDANVTDVANHQKRIRQSQIDSALICPKHFGYIHP